MLQSKHLLYDSMAMTLYRHGAAGVTRQLLHAQKPVPEESECEHQEAIFMLAQIRAMMRLMGFACRSAHHGQLMERAFRVDARLVRSW